MILNWGEKLQVECHIRYCGISIYLYSAPQTIVCYKKNSNSL
jgi:hypothetical protein